MASTAKKAYLLRIDPALWLAIERLAADELRSTNAQVEFLLREALQRRGRQPGPLPAGRPDRTDPAALPEPEAPG